MRTKDDQNTKINEKLTYVSSTNMKIAKDGAAKKKLIVMSFKKNENNNKLEKYNVKKK